MNSVIHPEEKSGPFKYGTLLVAEEEHSTLTELLTYPARDKVQAEGFERLRDELSKARVVPASAVPVDVIRLDSHVKLRNAAGTIMEIQLVLPYAASVPEKKVSILSPLGTAVFGYAAGDKITWPFPGRTETFEIMEVKAAN